MTRAGTDGKHCVDRAARGRLVARSAATLMAALGGVLAVPAVAGAATQTFGPGTNNVPFVVPDGVTSVQVDATGAPGGGGFFSTSGGQGAHVTGTLAVTPGQTLYLTVGTGGGTGTQFNVGGGGFNGGASGANGGYSGGGGGGAADVRTCSPDCTPVLVAAGGGGGGGGPEGNGGGGGGDGGNGRFYPCGGGGGGAGGPTSGGSGGTGGSAGGMNGTSGTGGSLGSGGGGGAAQYSTGGGGGGGYYGGGGGGGAGRTAAGADCGGGGGGGGGGSNLVPPDGSVLATSSNPQILLTYKATPDVTTRASGSVAAGGSVHDTADLTGGMNSPSGSVTFTLYGPGDTGCSAAPVFTSAPVTVSGAGSYDSPNFTTTQAGVHRWRASYSGDDNNDAVATACDDVNAVTVTKATPSLAATPSGSVTIGGSVRDTVEMQGGFNPSGSITFTLYGPADTGCSAAPVFTSAPVTVSGAGSYDSPNFTPTQAGVHRWRASYSGDDNNDAVATACGDANAVTVSSTPGTTPQTPARLTAASLTNSVFAVDSRGAAETPVAARRAKKGTTFRYKLSEAGRVEFTIQQRLPGRQVGTKCVKESRSNRSKRKCTRSKLFGRFAKQSVAGTNAKRWSGKIGKQTPSAGHYRATLVVTIAAGNRSAPTRLSFKIVD